MIVTALYPCANHIIFYKVDSEEKKSFIFYSLSKIITSISNSLRTKKKKMITHITIITIEYNNEKKEVKIQFEILYAIKIMKSVLKKGK